MLLLYCYINIRSSIVFCLSSGNTYLFLGISLSNPVFFLSLLNVSEIFCGELLETFVIESAILLPVKSPVASAVSFLIALFEAVSSASVGDYLA